MTGLYIHIPFCHAKCSYCDFATFVDQHHQIDNYLSALIKEMRFYEGRPLQTIFIGGGTPTVLSPAQIRFLGRAIHKTFDTSALTEATVEANPESADDDILKAYQDEGINRLSFGLQTTDNTLLANIGRLHSFEWFGDAYARARQLGFRNINIDLIFGLPGQTEISWKGTLTQVVGLNPEHISTYALKIEAGTKMAKENVMIDNDREALFYLTASENLTTNGYRHYEISNFSKPGFESRHNQLYWEQKNTIGVGLSATSYIDGRRFKNTPSLPDYMQKIEAGVSPILENSTLDPDEKEREDIMMALRLDRGVEEERVNKLKLPMAETFLKQGLAKVQNGYYALTPQGWLLSNQLFQWLV